MIRRAHRSGLTAIGSAILCLPTPTLRRSESVCGGRPSESSPHFTCRLSMTTSKSQLNRQSPLACGDATGAVRVNPPCRLCTAHYAGLRSLLGRNPIGPLSRSSGDDTRKLIEVSVRDDSPIITTIGVGRESTEAEYCGHSQNHDPHRFSLAMPSNSENSKGPSE